MDCVEGRVELLDLLPGFLKQWGWTGSPEAFVETWLSVENAPNAEVLDVVATIRAQGMPCFVASTQERLRARYIEHDMGFGRLFDGLFFSCDVGFAKPKPGFYAALAQSVGVPGRELLFFDDAPANVEGAQVAGWNAHLFTGVEVMRRDAERYTGLRLGGN
jgi:putative hydrolase of the HAD superfamily